MLFNSFIVGLSVGWIAPTIVNLQQPDSVLPITEEQASWIASISEIGRMSSPFVSPFIVDTVGRKYSVMLVATLFLVIWPVQIFVRDALLLCIIRLVFGLINGIHDVVASIYTTENCFTKLRGVIGSTVTVVFLAGCFVELFLATYFAYVTVAIVNTIFTICSFGTMYFCTETPYFLIMKEKFYEAEQNLVWLRGGSLNQNELSNTMEKLKQNVQEEKRKGKSIKTLFTSKANFKSIYIVLTLYTMASATGHSAIVPYSSVIFPSSGTLTSNHFTILYGVTNFIAVCSSPFVVKMIGRRKLIIVSFAILALCNSSAFLLFFLRSRNYDIECFPWLIFLSVALYGATRSVQFPAIFVIRGELLPLSVRAIGGSMAVVVNAGTGFFVSKLFLPVTESFGMETNFLVYALLSAFMVVFTYMVLPETKGKSLDEIQMSLEGKKPKIFDEPRHNFNVLDYKTGNNKFTLTAVRPIKV